MPYYLDANLLYLDNEYMDIYTMSYLDTSKLDIPKLISKIKSRPFNIDINILPPIIKDKFHPFNMNKYFGSRSDLSCTQTRRVYKEMVKYFINLFKIKMFTITGIDVENIVDKNHYYICILAKCLNIIRGSIKKYARNRTSFNQPRRCSKKHLDFIDSKSYDCPFPIDDDTICPSFEYLREKDEKSCKDIIYSSKKTNKRITFGSKVYRYFSYIPKNNKSRLLSALPITRKLKFIKTRRHKKFTRNNNKKPKISTIYSTSDSNISHNSINKNIPNSNIKYKDKDKNQDTSNSNITHNTIN